MTDNKEIILIVKKVYQDKKVVKYLGDFKNERKIQMKLCKNAAKYTKASNPQGFVILPVNCYKRVLYRRSQPLQEGTFPKPLQESLVSKKSLHKSPVSKSPQQGEKS